MLMTVVEGLRRARLASGLTLRAVAQRSGIAEANLSTIEHARRDPTATTIDRLTAALGIRLVPVATGGRPTAADIADIIGTSLRASDETRAYRAAVQLADDLDSADPHLKLLLTTEPARTGDPGWDAFLAAVTEWRLQQAGLPAPDWVRQTGTPVAAPWSPPGAILEARPDHVAEPFLRRGVLVEAAELTST